MTDRRTQDMPAREIEAVLSPLPTTRPSGYSFINERRRPARPVIDEVTVPKEPREAAPSPVRESRPWLVGDPDALELLA